MSLSGTSLTIRSSRRRPDVGRKADSGRRLNRIAQWVRVARRSRDCPGELGRYRTARHRQLRLDGRGRVPAGAADDAATRRSPREPTGALAGRHLSAASPVLGRAASQRRDHRRRACRHRRALIELAGGKTPRGGALLCENPQVQDAVGRADAILNAGRAYRRAMIAELWNTVASGPVTTLEQRARCRLAAVYAPTARARRWI